MNVFPRTSLKRWLFGATLLACLALPATRATEGGDEGDPESQPTTQPDSQPASTQATSEPATSTTTTTAASEPAKEKEKDKYFAVINGRVHTVTGPVVEDATVLAKNGIIEAIGQDVRLPDECEILDARGMNVFPGLVAAAAGGIHGGNNPEDTTDVFGLSMRIASAAGITTALAGNDAAKLTVGSIDDMIVRRDLFVSLSYDRDQPLARAELRADLDKVRNYLRDLGRYEIEKSLGNEDAKEPDKEWIKGKYENYLKLLQGTAKAIATANRMQELLDFARLAEEYGFRLVLRGAWEGWIVPDHLGRAGIQAIVTPRIDIAPDEELNRPSGTTIENAKILRSHGVPIAIVPQISSITTWGLAGRDLLHLNMEAAFAVRGGLSNDAAIRTITIDAARILGIDHRVGSLEVGKDADLIVVDGDLLHYMTQVHYTVVNGRVTYDKREESLFAHIRPDGKAVVPEFDDQWPRRLAWPEHLLKEPAETQPEGAGTGAE